MNDESATAASKPGDELNTTSMPCSFWFWLVWGRPWILLVPPGPLLLLPKPKVGDFIELSLELRAFQLTQVHFSGKNDAFQQVARLCIPLLIPQYNVRMNKRLALAQGHVSYTTHQFMGAAIIISRYLRFFWS